MCFRVSCSYVRTLCFASTLAAFAALAPAFVFCERQSPFVTSLRRIFVPIECILFTVTLKQTNGCTPLYVASQVSHLDIVSALLAAGANKDAATVHTLCFDYAVSTPDTVFTVTRHSHMLPLVLT